MRNIKYMQVGIQNIFLCYILQEIVSFRVGGIDGIRNVYKPISFFQLKGWGLGVVEENHIQHQTFTHIVCFLVHTLIAECLSL